MDAQTTIKTTVFFLFSFLFQGIWTRQNSWHELINGVSNSSEGAVYWSVRIWDSDAQIFTRTLLHCLL